MNWAKFRRQVVYKIATQGVRIIGVNQWYDLRRGDIVKRWMGIVAGSVGGLAILAGIYGFVNFLLPPVVPAPAPAVASPPLEKARQATPAASSSPTVKSQGPFGFEPIQYALLQTVIVNQAHALHISLIAPKSSYPGTTLEESYVSHSILNIQYNNMIVMESARPIVSIYKPISTVAIRLNNGIVGQWEWIPGGGGPPYRLLFQQNGTYVRIQLYSPQVNNSLTSTEHVAEQFGPLA